MEPTAQKTDFSPARRPGHPAIPRAAGQFCGFSAAKAETNKKASQVVLVRANDKPITTKDFYRDMFDQQVKKADMRAVFTEFAWDMYWCDPCAANPLSNEALQSLGVFRLTETPPDAVPGRGPRSIMPPMGGAHDVMQHVWKDEDLSGPATDEYRWEVERRQENAARQLTDLTGWKLADIRQQMNLRTADAVTDGRWWQKLWTC